MLLNLQLLRAIAALAVVYYHTTSQAGLNLPVSVGAHGVDLFFVICGFIIARVAVQSSKGFRGLWPGPSDASRPSKHTRGLCPAPVFAALHSSDTPQAGMVPTLILGW